MSLHLLCCWRCCGRLFRIYRRGAPGSTARKVLPPPGNWSLESSHVGCCMTTEISHASHLLTPSRDSRRGSQMAEEHGKQSVQIPSPSSPSIEGQVFTTSAATKLS